MSRRNSGYERQERDYYPTPSWVTEALLPHLRPLRTIWEPSCGEGHMVRVLKQVGQVIATDILTGDDFLTTERTAAAIITNPPFCLAEEFIARALSLMAPDGLVAMLLPTDFGHAKRRKRLFEPPFARKVELTSRIKWFDRPVMCIHCRGDGCSKCGSKGVRNNSPKENHSWFVWDYLHFGPATIVRSDLPPVTSRNACGCGKPLTGRADAKFCSAACKQRAHRTVLKYRGAIAARAASTS
jgi:hypothetical protein